MELQNIFDKTGRMSRGGLGNGKTDIIRNRLTNKPPGTAPEIDTRFEIEQILRSGRIHGVPPSKGNCDGGEDRQNGYRFHAVSPKAY
ncbi:MAG: hypothetical protein RIR52_2035, partial [Acidobacteriota bacterium]